MAGVLYTIATHPDLVVFLQQFVELRTGGAEVSVAFGRFEAIL